MDGQDMLDKLDLATLKAKAQLKDRYAKQLHRINAAGIQTDCIDAAVSGVVDKLVGGSASALVVYGEPQSGKTEMMICLTAKLLDSGFPVIVHLLNDSVDLLTQNLSRFKKSGLAPAAKTSSEFPPNSSVPNEVVVLCKKNTKDLQNLINWLDGNSNIVVIDDEADYATPNSQINKGTKTKINQWVGDLLGADGKYIGVTATPARLNLNNTFQNDTNNWVKFPPHKSYTGQDIFFPLDSQNLPYRLTRLTQGGSSEEAEEALLRFLVTVAYLNTTSGPPESNYTMLVHTSGSRDAHEADRLAIEKTVSILLAPTTIEFDQLGLKIYDTAKSLYPNASAQALTEYVIENASRTTLVVLNSKRDRKAAGDSATVPTSPFTIIIGGNIVSRGVTFPSLLSMFFTRDVKSKLQQDTYIQRARMFGSRTNLEHFELTIPSQLYADWQKCFVYHRLSLATIESKLGVPVWIGDSRIAVASSSSIDMQTVTLDKGEISFGQFVFSEKLDEIVKDGPTTMASLAKLREAIGEEALPQFLIDYVASAQTNTPNSLAIHTSSSIAGYKKGVDHDAISRKKGFIGAPQLEIGKFPNAVHHIKIFSNANGNARLFYKFTHGGVNFMHNEPKKVA
jgi:hypothetical protein